ncbi:MAG TPA: complex I NDUFA9 subunit family protein [Paracoccaceae bacterium]|nr:complex I NDUFA9 subunit family protein [Paracoccaceae bacterium]
MTTSAPIVTIFGGSGFLGRYVAQRMARAGWRVRVATRRPNEALFVKPYGAVGQVEPILANIRNEDSVRGLIRGSTAVVNCVGILNEIGRQKFGAVQAEGAARVARIAAEEGVEHLVHISAIGADANSESAYARTKAAGEAAVLENFPSAVILRPSIMFGNEDGFFNKFAGLARISPIVPIVGGDTKFQPVFVDNVAEAAAKGAIGEVPAGIYELAGPEVATFRELIHKMLGIVRRRRLVMNVPFFLAGIKAWGLDMVQAATGGLVENRLLTRDQVKNLANDNVATGEYPGLSDLGIMPTAMDGVLESYLYCFRPQGQYTALTASAKNLKG